MTVPPAYAETPSFPPDQPFFVPPGGGFTPPPVIVPPPPPPPIDVPEPATILLLIVGLFAVCLGARPPATARISRKK